MERPILDAIEAAAARGEQAAVATVVSTIRSAPRQPGAKYVVTEGGTYVGSVSGGCVEPDVAERAREVFAGGPANLIHYGVSDSDAFEVGLSCGGEIDVWLEKADPELWREVRAVLDADEYATLYTNTEAAEQRAAYGRQLGWRTTVVDARAALATPERLPSADEIVRAWPDQVLDRI